MCGIVGYIGKRESQDILFEGLKKLEYRGYDSAGIAVSRSNGLEVRKSIGRLANLEGKLKESRLQDRSALGIHAGQLTANRPM